MILHTGVDGGMHDVLMSNAFAALAWVLLGVNAVIYYGRLIWRRIKGGKD